MLNPNFGRGAIGQSSPVNIVNLGLPQTHTGLGEQRVNRNEPAIPMSNLYYDPPNPNNITTGRTLRQDETTRPLLIHNTLAGYLVNSHGENAHKRNYNAGVV